MHHRARPTGERAGDRDARKTSTRPEVHPHPCLRRQRQELERIGNMPGPKQRKRGFGDEVDLFLPEQQLADVNLETFLRFTRNRRERERAIFIAFEVETALPAFFQARFAALRPRFTCATKSVSAAGVIPSILPACPIVRGRFCCSFCLASLESPRMPS